MGPSKQIAGSFFIQIANEMTYRIAFHLLKRTISDWNDHKVPQLGAALAYYSILSLGPLLLLALAIAALIFGQDAAHGRIIAEIDDMVGHEGARAIEDMIKDSARHENTGIFAAIIGAITLLFGASGVFSQLQDSMNIIWNVKPRKDAGVWNIIKNRFVSFSMVLGTGFLLLTSLIISAALSAMSEYASGYLGDLTIPIRIIEFVISLLIVSLLFAAIFKYLPDTYVAWHDVWFGGIITSLLFTLGKFAIGFYLGQSSFSSSYGAAGSLVVLLVWVYYSSQILFFGAEFTQVYAKYCEKKRGLN